MKNLLWFQQQSLDVMLTQTITSTSGLSSVTIAEVLLNQESITEPIISNIHIRHKRESVDSFCIIWFFYTIALTMR